MLLQGAGPTGLKQHSLFPRHPSTYLVIAAVIAVFLFSISAEYKTIQGSHMESASRISDSKAASSATSRAQEGHWIATWSSAQQPCPLERDVTPFGSLIPDNFIEDGVALPNTTIRQTVKLSLGADEIRIRLANTFGDSALRIEKITIALPLPESIDGKLTSAGSSAIQTTRLQTLSFGGQAHAFIPSNGHLLSDPVKFPVQNGEVITVSMYLEDGQNETDYITCHMDSKTTSWLSKGDYTARPTFDKENAETKIVWYMLDTVEAWKPLDHGTVVVLGDSITDSSAAVKNMNDRWTNNVFDRLQNSTSDYLKKLAVVNQAISGNQVINDGVGPNLNARLDRDAISINGLKYAVIHEGIIDVGSGRDTDDVLVQLRQATARFHAANIPVFGGTLSPWSCTDGWSPWKGANAPTEEQHRLRVNWEIRNRQVYDAVIDFDAMLRNPQNATEQFPDYRGRDCVHPNPTGMLAMARGFPIDVFEKFMDGVPGHQ